MLLKRMDIKHQFKFIYITTIVYVENFGYENFGYEKKIKKKWVRKQIVRKSSKKLGYEKKLGAKKNGYEKNWVRKKILGTKKKQNLGTKTKLGTKESFGGTGKWYPWGNPFSETGRRFTFSIKSKNN